MQVPLAHPLITQKRLTGKDFGRNHNAKKSKCIILFSVCKVADRQGEVQWTKVRKGKKGKKKKRKKVKKEEKRNKK